MAYLKPQSPIKYKEDHILPLTSIDQVLMTDGQRLSSVGVYLEKPKDTDDTTVCGNNADTLGGIAASDYVLKTDTIANAENADRAIEAETFGGMTYKQIMELEHGIGSFYFTLSEIDNPNTKWDWMTWELVTDKFLLGAGNTYEVGSEGGEAEHTLTIDEMPNHYHLTYSDHNYSAASTGNTNEWKQALVNANNHAVANGYYDLPAGGNQPHNNMPPYISVFMWTRTA